MYQKGKKLVLAHGRRISFLGNVWILSLFDSTTGALVVKEV